MIEAVPEELPTRAKIIPIRSGLLDYLPQPQARQNPQGFLGQYWRLILHFDQLIQSGTYKLKEGYTPASWLGEGRMDEEVWDSVLAPKSVAIFYMWPALKGDKSLSYDIYKVPGSIAALAEEQASRRFGPDTQFAAKYSVIEIQAHRGIEHSKEEHQELPHQLFFISQFVNSLNEPLTIKTLS